MYKVRNKVFSEAGYLLQGKNKTGYLFEGELSDFTERPISLDDIKLEGSFVRYDGIVQYIGQKYSYETLKRDMVKRRYSNDDQIAIVLNNDLDSITKMQEWRDWSSLVAHKIMELSE